MAKKKASKKKAAKKLPAKSSQKHFKGMAPPKIGVVEKAAKAYANTRDERQELTKTESEEKAKLMEIMKKNLAKIGTNGAGESVYKLEDGREVVYCASTDESVKVRTPKKEKKDAD